MNWNDPQRDALDDLLHAAAWPEPNAEQVERLQQEWRGIVRRRNNRRVVTASLAMAALVLLAVYVGSSFVNRSDIPIAREILAPSPTSSQTVVTSESTPPIAREPDAFELAIAMVYRRPTELPPTVVQQEAQPVLQPEPPADVVDAAAVEEKFAAMYSSRIAVRLTAAEGLGSLNNPSISKRLVQMVLEGEVRRESLIALLHSSDPIARDFLALAQNDLALGPSLRAIHVQPTDLDSTN